MNRNILIAIGAVAIVVIAVFGLLSLLAGDVCPPPGWQGPRPPWCEQPPVPSPFGYRELTYISGTGQLASKELLLGIGTMDMWGNPHVWIDMGEDPVKNLDSTMERIGTIGSKAVYISDFAMFNDKFEVTYVTEDLIPKAVTITPDEMKQITKSAKKNNQGMLMLVTNLYDPLATISLGLTGSSVDRTKGAFRTPGLDLRTADEDTKIQTFNIIWPGWKEIILQQADKAEAAGIDYMTINPNDQAFEYIIKSDILDDRYRELIPEVRKRFSGKIGLIGMLPHISWLESVQDVDFILISWDPNADYIAEDIFADTKNTDINDIEASFSEWLSQPEWEKFKGKEVYISVTLPSYTGALQEGWIEPALGEERWTINYREQALGYEGLFRALYKGDYNIKGVFSYGYWWSDQLYPVTKDLRNDLMHTIRQKDAENVFYKWSKVFV